MRLHFSVLTLQYFYDDCITFRFFSFYDQSKGIDAANRALIGFDYYSISSISIWRLHILFKYWDINK